MIAKVVSTMTKPTNDESFGATPAGRPSKSAGANPQPATRTTLHSKQAAPSQSRATKRLTPDALGMKALITTTSLAVTLGGWAVLAIERPTPPAVVDAPIAEALAIEAPTAGFELSLAPMPTIAPPPPRPPEIVINTPPPAPAAQPVVRRATNQVAARPASVRKPAAPAPAPAAPMPQPAPAAPMPQPAPAAPVPQPPLRVVSAPPKPPKPVARTRSSR
jgi:hypothetical protein